MAPASASTSSRKVYESTGSSVLERTEPVELDQGEQCSCRQLQRNDVADIQKSHKQPLPAGVPSKYLGGCEEPGRRLRQSGHRIAARHYPRLPHHGCALRKRGVPVRGAVLHTVASIGALLGIGLTMQPLSIFAIVGSIMLLGLVSKNGSGRGLHQPPRKKGMGPSDAFIEAEGTTSSSSR